jgi:broad specificity phosphatase PhoE
MDIVFVRHGHGEHLLDYPNQLNTLHPGLTSQGEDQVNQLRGRLTIVADDLIIASPTKRTIQTARILTGSNRFYVSPLVGPRMFPQNPEFPELVCDRIYSKDELGALFDNIEILDLGLDCWNGEMNRMEQPRFEEYAKQLLEWCREMVERVVIVAHDGTIQSYRMLLGEHGLTRKDFLGEAGVYRMQI